MVTIPKGLTCHLPDLTICIDIQKIGKGNQKMDIWQITTTTATKATTNNVKSVLKSSNKLTDLRPLLYIVVDNTF